MYCNCHLFEFQSSLHDIRCVATTLTDSNCTSNWVPHRAGEFTNSPWLHSGASTLTECKTACEFDPRCVAADWVGHLCWITTNPHHGHWIASHDPRTSYLRNYVGHYYLKNRCDITPGQCFQHISAHVCSCCRCMSVYLSVCLWQNEIIISMPYDRAIFLVSWGQMSLFWV